MKKLPLGMQTFRDIVKGKYVYVDKTRFVYNIANSEKYYFLSRPRRFGKSLLLDTIAEAFSGDRELFKGLWIYDSDHDFIKHPVIRLDMSNIANDTPEILRKSLSIALIERAKKEGIDVGYEMPSDNFKVLIEKLQVKYGQNVVVLIDEYDKPILDHLNRIETAEANRQVMRGFYGILKSMDPYLRMTFITGVSKFTKTSIFSELNNIRDITMSEQYADICGVAIEDLEKYFGEHIDHLSSLGKFKCEGGLHNAILDWYDGYSWNGETRVINPYSLLSFFTEGSFESFWYSSGTPTFLIDMIKNKPSSFLVLNNHEISKKGLDTFEIQKIELAPLLFQTGYLTVAEKSARGIAESYTLKIPNLEVREAFYLNLLANFTESEGYIAESAFWRMQDSLEAGNLQGVLETMKSLFSSIPYELHIKHEHYYHSIFYSIMNLLGFDIDAEVSVSGGRVDAVLELAENVYVMEFKYVHCEKDASAQEKRKLFDAALDDGMKQIKDRGYARKFEGCGKTVHHAAFAFLGRDDIDMRTDKH